MIAAHADSAPMVDTAAWLHSQLTTARSAAPEAPALLTYYVTAKDSRGQILLADQIEGRDIAHVIEQAEAHLIQRAGIAPAEIASRAVRITGITEQTAA